MQNARKSWIIFQISGLRYIGVMKLSCLVAAAWCVASTYALDVKLSGINYNPRKGADWDPYDKRCKSADEVKADMTILSSITSNIRLYSMTDCNQVEVVVPAAKAAGLSVWLGMWIGKDGAGYDSEKAKLSSLISSNVIDNTIAGLHVGSETVYRKDLTSKQAIAYMQEIKTLVVGAGLSFPVTIADIGDSYMWYPELASAVDVISINQFPFWEGRDVETAIQFFADRVAPIISMAKTNNKKIMVGETGWATAGTAKGAGIASPENAATWLNDFHVYAKEQGWNYYYFTSFDTPWKHNANDANSESEVENHFGLFDAQGKLKSCFADLNVKKRDIKPTPTNSTSNGPTTTPVNVKPMTNDAVSVNTSNVPVTTSGSTPSTTRSNSTKMTTAAPSKSNSTKTPSPTATADSSSSSSTGSTAAPSITAPATGAGTSKSTAPALSTAVPFITMVLVAIVSSL
ncbi:hypothetical protein AeMF1_004571 [Aphanomyces euteiches]|nr:hypothetical protein AeMF1_004571 [Aphanomyces euteiches]KAH9183695.1 hypothetical protein AeNC1_014328 [Aphanomyces euteiches]